MAILYYVDKRKITGIYIMAIGALTEGDKARIKSVIEQGVQCLQEVATIRGDIKEAVGTVSEELDIEKRYINKAIRTAYKNAQKGDQLTIDREELDAVEELLMAAGKA